MNINWKRQHKWSSLTVAFFMVLFCLSGIVLNHREAFSGLSVSRSLLPPFYRHHDWNGGLMRGTLRLPFAPDRVAVYGNGGVWVADSAMKEVTDFNDGLPAAPDLRNIRAMASSNRGSALALATTGLYRRDSAGEAWRKIKIPDAGEETFSDLLCEGDSLIVMGRSHLYVSAYPWRSWRKITPAAPSNADIGGTTAFRTVWMLHSGQLFGIVGVIIVDIIAGILILLCVTGMMIWLIPKQIRRRGVDIATAKRYGLRLKENIHVHRRVGVATVVLTMLVVITGWSLRPPVLIPLAKTHVEVVPGTALDSPNPWNDKLRMIRRDPESGSWLFSTSAGFFEAESLDGVPRKMDQQPPVSVMGLNVWQRLDDGRWLVGSFSGASLWDINRGVVTDYVTGEPVARKAGPPFGKLAVAGYTRDFGPKGEIVLYDDGCRLPQPERLSTLPMSLWNVALEVHNGRIFFGNAATWFYITLVGAIAFWCLLSGYKIARKRRNPHKNAVK